MMSTNLHILHIDDSAFDRQLVRDALEQNGQHFRVTTAASREEFEAQLPADSYDLVLTDFNILGFEGLQVIDAVHAQNPEVPVIVITGTGSEEIAVEAMKRGAADYVIKSPQHIRRLPLAIQAALERKWLQSQKLQSERALRDSEARLRAFAQALPDLAFILDEDGRYIQILSTREHLLYTFGERLIGRLVEEVLPQGIADRIRHTIHRTIETGQTQAVEYQLPLSTGLTWFEGRTSLMATRTEDKALVVYIVRDITEKKEAELRLRRERNLLRTLIDNVPDYIFVIDTKGQFVASNTAHAAAASLNPAQLIGKTAADVFPSDFAAHFHHDDERIMSSSAPLISEERLITDAEGNQQSMLMTKVPLRNESGEVIGLVGIARDITERLKAEKLRLELEKEQEVIALKERFIATATHDFRTPLSIIKMSANMLETDFDRFTPAKRTAKLHQIGVQVNNIVQLLEDVLTMSKANAGKLDFKPETLALHSFCQQIWDNFVHIAEKTHEMEFVYTCDQEYVYLDPNLVNYILVNLISNAIKYSPVNGHVRFEVAREGGYVVFRISDNGIGIPLEDQARLFEPFHRASNTRGITGTGLGLSIVKSYVDAHHGGVEVESTENQGSQFSVYLPIN